MEGGELVLLAYRPLPTDEIRALVSPLEDIRVKGAMQSNVPVVVAAKGSGGIARSAELAVVPYESGEIVIRRERGTQAIAVSHYSGGAAVRQKIEITVGKLKIAAKILEGRMPLEWIEVTITEED